MAIKLFKSKADKKRDAFVKMAGEFASETKRKDALIIMCDPDTDVLVATYRGVISAVHRKRNIAVVRNLIELNRDTREGALLNQFVQDLAYMCVSIGDKLVNEKAMRKGLIKAHQKAASEGKQMVAFGAADEKGNTKEVIAL